MVDLKDAIRKEIYTSPKGNKQKVYIFQCKNCKIEIKKTSYYAKKCTGYCKKCNSSNIHTKKKDIRKEKECNICEQVRTMDNFYFKGNHRENICKHCKNIRRLFGINANDYDEMFKRQDGKCAICKSNRSHKHQNGKETKFAIDHDHQTGKIRGLLCAKCNCSLGGFKDSIVNLKEAIKYLEKHDNKSKD